ncbi:cellulase family glycosylhydrolase [Flavihumibacter sp. UBA7668]|uniref:cellulase family glycosylhydrolase n=1 Tax=Flavihumibacter sp. UBA7668 TaxID=1946542 RepID=UPI0025BC451B|nr:cellulase family glycosylhydrolase [Flavihumibacter sp. UBA7668]
MKRINQVRKLLLHFIWMLPLLPFQLSAQGFIRASGEQIVDRNGQNILFRGMGLGGWMLQEGYMLKVNGIGQQQHVIRKHIEELIGPEKTAEFYTEWLSNHTTRKDIEAMKAWGFNSVRLPMHYNLYTLPIEKEPVKGKHTWLQQGFEYTDSLLSWCRDNQVYLILDLHAAPGGQGNDLNISDADPSKPFLWQSEENLQKTIALWKKLADRYKNEPWIAAYDIINEPNWGFTDPADKNGLQEQGNQPLKKLMQDITTAIRSVDTNHLIIIEGNGWGNNYNGILPPWDKNMALSFHKYWNYNTQEAIQQFLDFRKKYQVPIWLGETGENSNTWFTQAISLMERNNIGWCWWPLKKIGINNPLEIKSTEGYNAVLNYWAKKGPRPTPEIAYQGLLELARNTHFDKAIQHIDVVDAMFRQVNSTATIPYKTTTIQHGTILSAADYDLGRNGLAYFDLDTANYRVSTGKGSAGNRGHAYRNDGVDIRMMENNKYTITHTEPGEWLQYTVHFSEAGTYTIELLLSAHTQEGALEFTLIGEEKAHRISVPKAFTKGEWKYFVLPALPVQAGERVLQVKFLTSGIEFQSIRFTKSN